MNSCASPWCAVSGKPGTTNCASPPGNTPKSFPGETGKYPDKRPDRAAERKKTGDAETFCHPRAVQCKEQTYSAMNLKKTCLLSACLLSLCGGAFAQESATLDLRLKGLRKGDVLYLMNSSDRHTDTLTAVRNNRAEITVPVSQTTESILFYLPEGKPREELRNSEVRSLCLYPGARLTVKGDLSRIGRASVGGGLYQQHPYRDYFDTLDAIYAQANVYSDSLDAVEQTARSLAAGAERDSLIKELTRLNDKTWAVVGKSYQVMEDFVRRYPDDPFSAYVLTCIKGSRYEKVAGELFDLLGEKARNTPAGQEMEKRLTTSRAWEKAHATVQAGTPAPAFVLTGLDGKKISLSDFRGKYLVLDFWGSWCGPCREANKHMVALYDRYKDRPDFAMLSLALDRDDAAWRQAVREDSLSWPQVNMCETPDGPASVNVLYGVNLYPTQMLVSPDGQILVRQNGFNAQKDAISARLADIFKE